MSELQDAWLAAWDFAACAHKIQKIPGRDLPYIVHLGAVSMEILIAHQRFPFARPVIAVQCALLHDTLEDTETNESELVTAFGMDVAAGVRALTKDPALPKKDAMDDSLRRIRIQSAEIWAVKMADRISNLGPPPAHWTDERIEAYRAEAQSILEALGEAHDPLAIRLGNRIATYPRVVGPHDPHDG